MEWIIISYYTVGTGYEVEIEKLRQSLIKFELPHHIEGIKSRGSWIKNVHYNNELILKAFDMFPDKAIVSLDADAVVERYPALFDTLDCDFAAHMHTWKSGRVELLCSTMYWQGNRKTRKFLAEVIERHKVYPQETQQPGMLRTLKSWGIQRIKFVSLPPQYARIFDLMESVKYPVINQYQASRRFRKAVNRAGMPKQITTRDLK
jgi:hypothetical protein